ncbi:hypothetical protein HMPREF0063_11999 [Aeromicrobium marinum DSM 15272]|uniref:TPM domain-containing protein n=1 Tax=Aeromicrobium marinum DSM 15272 TaxID=585531 RepID=E2SE63_9ACTN|nr:TPM domain-containing protein [Aeromicrobium marinum]EFQ82790.1 hypothetical protein HMPREF0063_11999 [Aeromicrobium marinum DSM 15272]
MRAWGRVLLLTAALTWGASTAAVAEQPVDVSGPVTDRSGVLGPDLERVQAAIDDLFEQRGVQLFVVYVDDFDGLDGAVWADASATTSGIGDTDLLLAVATTERSYGFSVPPGGDISDGELERIDRERVLPELRDEDWAGAAVAAVEGVDDALEPGTPWGLITLGGATVLGGAGVAGWQVARHRGRRASLAELDQQVGQSLVAIDDRLRAAAQEIGFAQAEFGEDATTAFAETLATAQQKVREAFALQQSLDDEHPETDDEHRRVGEQILTICAEIDALVDAQVDEFDALRDLLTRAPEVLQTLPPRIDELERRIPAARATLTELAARHRADDLLPYADNPDQAVTLLAAAREDVAAGGATLTSDRPAAARHVRSAQSAVGLAAAEIEAVEGAAADLTALEAGRERATSALTRVSGQVKAVSTFIDARSGAVGSTARTRLSEAARRLDEAASVIGSDHTAATALLDQAAEQAAEAQRLASADVTTADRPRSTTRSSTARRGSSSRRSSSTRSRSRSRSSSSRRSRGGRF